MDSLKYVMPFVLVYAFASTLSPFVVFNYVSDIALELQSIRLHHFSILFTWGKKKAIWLALTANILEVFWNALVFEVSSKGSLHWF